MIHSKASRVITMIALSVLIGCLLVAAGCQGAQTTVLDTTQTSQTTEAQATATPSPSPEPTATPTPTPGPLNPLTGLELADPEAQGQRPVAIMINNINTAVPQIGIASADLMFEMPVEWKITRQMAVFADVSQIPEIGSIRSARHDYIDMAGGLDAILVHVGASNLANDQFAKQDTDHIDLHVYPKAYWRDPEWRTQRGYEHSVKTTGELLAAALEDSGDRTELLDGSLPAFQFRPIGEFEPAAGDPALSVAVPYSADYCVATFDYDENTRLYAKGQYGADQIDLATDQAISFTNVILIMTRVTICDDAGHKDADLESGNGYYISGGAWQAITWTKGGTEDRLVIRDLDGNEIRLNTGKSYIGIVPDTRTISFD